MPLKYKILYNKVKLCQFNIQIETAQADCGATTTPSYYDYNLAIPEEATTTPNYNDYSVAIPESYYNYNLPIPDYVTSTPSYGWAVYDEEVEYVIRSVPLFTVNTKRGGYDWPKLCLKGAKIDRLLMLI